MIATNVIFALANKHLKENTRSAPFQFNRQGIICDGPMVDA
jgi:hypothetical protein